MESLENFAMQFTELAHCIQCVVQLDQTRPAVSTKTYRYFPYRNIGWQRFYPSGQLRFKFMAMGTHIRKYFDDFNFVARIHRLRWIEGDIVLTGDRRCLNVQSG